MRKRMSEIGRAVAIFKAIEVANVTYKEKVGAIKMVAEMPTHNGITKDEILKAVRWLLEETFEWEESE